jgi:hypothetical protein
MLEKVERSRIQYVDQTITSVNQHVNDLLEGKAGCSLACASIHLGFFTKALHIRGLRSPLLTHPYSGISPKKLLSRLDEISATSCYREFCASKKCPEKDFIRKLVSKTKDEIDKVGLSLSAFPSQRKRKGQIDNLYW